MSTRETILQGCRAWIKAATGQADAKVIPHDDKGNRPALPYMTVKLTSADVPIGVDEDLGTLSDLLTVTTAAAGSAYSLTVNGTAISYTRLLADTNATIAVAVAALIDAVASVSASADDDEITVVAYTGVLTLASPVRLTHESGVLPAYTVGAIRRATLSVQGFGDASDWLDMIAIRARLPAIKAIIDAAGLSVRAMGGTTDIAALLDTSIESRFLREFEITYAMRTLPVTAIPLETVETELTLVERSGDPDPLVVEITTDATP